MEDQSCFEKQEKKPRETLSPLLESLEKLLTTPDWHNFCLGLAATPELLWHTLGCGGCPRWRKRDSTSQADTHKKRQEKRAEALKT